MAPSPAQSASNPRQTARDGLRNRAVLREGELRDRQHSRAQKRLRLYLSPEEATSRLLLSQHLDVSGNYPPNTKRSSAARARQLHAMFNAYGPLVFLRFSLPALDGYVLHDKELPALARAALDDKVWGIVDDAAPYTADFHRATGSHIHMVTPLVFLVDYYRNIIDNAPHGVRGGVDLPFFIGHGVVIGNTAADRERVAAYVRCHPDARLKAVNTPGYLDALEDDLQRKAAGLTFGRLGWDGGGVRHL